MTHYQIVEPTITDNPTILINAINDDSFGIYATVDQHDNIMILINSQNNGWQFVDITGDDSFAASTTRRAAIQAQLNAGQDVHYFSTQRSFAQWAAQLKDRTYV